MNSFRLIPRLVLASVLACFASPGQADVITWAASGGGSWSVAGNWDLNRIPANGDSVVIANATAGATYQNDIVGLELANLTVSGSSLALSGNAVTLTDAGALVAAPVSGSTLSFGLPLELSAPTNIFSNTGAGTVSLTGVLGTKGALAVNAGNFSFASTASCSNAYAVIVTGTGKIALNQSKTFKTSVALVASDTGKFELATGVRQACIELRLDGKKQSDDTYGATGSGAGTVNNVHFAGNGLVDLNSAGFVMLLQ